MKHLIFLTVVFMCMSLNGQINTDIRYQQGYFKPSTGTYVEPHFKTHSNSTNWDNFSTKGNQNPFNGNSGYRARDFSNDAWDYGSGRTIHTGSQGGQFYYNNNGNKVYVPKTR